MRKVFAIFIVLGMLTACTETQTSATSIPSETLHASTSTPELGTVSPASTPAVELSPVPSSNDDFFTQNSITLPAPNEACNGLTQTQTEGPYYRADTPERTSLLEEGMQGTRLILVGYVLDQNCQPLPNTWLDFWQADANGEYDNTGYRLRGHQFTDALGRYHLETILPGLYASRPIEHIHVKVRPEGGNEITSQLYFPEQSVEGLTITIEDRVDYLLGFFSFVVQK